MDFRYLFPCLTHVKGCMPKQPKSDLGCFGIITEVDTAQKAPSNEYQVVRVTFMSVREISFESMIFSAKMT